MRIAPSRAFGLLLVTLLAAAAVLIPSDARTDTATGVAHYVAGTQARAKGDFDAYAKSMSDALQELRGHSILYRHIAQAHCLAGRLGPALAALQHLAETGAYFELQSNEDFETLRENPEFIAAMEVVEANKLPLGEATVYRTLDDPLLVPEGIAYDPVEKALYVSSIRGRKILKVGPDGKTEDFAKGLASYYAGLGLKVDAQRRTLWAVSASFNGMLGHDESNHGWASLSAFDLETGERTREFVVEASVDVTHNFNDLVLDSAGTVFLTDAATGALYSLPVGSDELEELFPAGTLFGPNGIALDEEHGLLYVAQYSLDIAVIDLVSQEIGSLAQSDEVATFGVDGLYFHDNELIAVQNHPALDRIARFVLGEGGKSIDREEILARRLEAFEEPTTGTFVDGDFVFIANSQIAIYDQMEPPVAPDSLQPIVLLRVKL